jgi:hypothetical protein
LAALAAGVTGSRAIIERDYFYEKTVPALVAQMNAERKKALIPILNGMARSIDDYSIVAAISDLDDYYQVGTFAGAINAIQADANVKEAAQNVTINEITKVPASQIDYGKALNTFLGKLRSDQSKLGDMNAVLKDLGEQSLGAPAAAADRLKAIYLTREGNDKQVQEFQDAMKAHNLDPTK